MMTIIIVAFGVCIIASMSLNFWLIDELEKADKKLEELEEERSW